MTMRDYADKEFLKVQPSGAIRAIVLMIITGIALAYFGV